MRGFEARHNQTVLVVGSGGREHALAWKLAQSPQVGRVCVAPGNAGMPEHWERWPVCLSEGHLAFEGLARRARQESVDLVVIGPDDPLAQGIVEIFEAYLIPTFGPSASAAQLEASKSFGKKVMEAAGVPTARYWIIHTREEAESILRSTPGCDWVIKVDGLALGKGVRVCESLEAGIESVDELLQISSALVIEECLVGQEVSWMAFCDGERCALLDPARDYKRLLDRDLGPNTGGMGAFSPVPYLTQSFENRIRNEVFLPVLKEMKRRGSPVKGILYAGLMVDLERDQFWVLEFNVRFGDPEAQVLLPRMEGDFFSWCWATSFGDLSSLPSRVPFKSECAVLVVAASTDYPYRLSTSECLQIDSASVPSLFFSAVGKTEEGWMARGGRTLGALGMGTTLTEAQKNAYEIIGKVSFKGMQYRSDIGSKV